MILRTDAGSGLEQGRFTLPPAVLHRTSKELAISSLELDLELQRDTRLLIRRALLSQRAIRIAGALLLGAIATAVRQGHPPYLLAVLLAVIAYVAVTWWAPAALNEHSQEAQYPSTVTAILLADSLTLSSLAFVLGGQSLTLILLGGAMLAATAAFHFGRSAGAITSVATGLGFVGAVFVAKDLLDPGAPSWSAAITSLGFFSLATAGVVYHFGGLRRRLNWLRLYCKLSEVGDPANAIPIDASRPEDDVTLLAKNVESLRSRLSEQVGSDPLTGCANRRMLETRLLADWRHARRRNTAVAVAAVDIDHFKQINDTRGHPTGDLVLRQIASIMTSTARDTDTVARVGGDEFVIVLPDTDHAGAVIFSERLLQRVMDFTFGSIDDPIAITVSIGVAIGAGADAMEPHQLIAAADRSLYRAKASGRNQVSA